jgi:hypothetical protein
MNDCLTHKIRQNLFLVVVIMPSKYIDEKRTIIDTNIVYHDMDG